MDQYIDESSEYKYYSRIPNIVLDIGLNPYELSLYVHIKRIAGDKGRCWMATEKLAEQMKMSVGQISKCKTVLIEQGLIAIEKQKGQHGGKEKHIIRILDVWKRNYEHFQKETPVATDTLSPTSPHEIATSPHEIATSPHEIATSPHEIATSPHEIEEDINHKENPYKEKALSNARAREAEPFQETLSGFAQVTKTAMSRRHDKVDEHLKRKSMFNASDVDIRLQAMKLFDLCTKLKMSPDKFLAELEELWMWILDKTYWFNRCTSPGSLALLSDGDWLYNKALLQMRSEQSEQANRQNRQSNYEQPSTPVKIPKFNTEAEYRAFINAKLAAEGKQIVCTQRQ